MGIVWMVKTLPVPTVGENVAVSFGQWEPFAVFEDTVWVKVQLHTEADEPKSSARHDLGNELAQEEIPDR